MPALIDWLHELILFSLSKSGLCFILKFVFHQNTMAEFCIFWSVVEGEGEERGTWKKMAIWDTCEPADSGLLHQQHLGENNHSVSHCVSLLMCFLRSTFWQDAYSHCLHLSDFLHEWPRRLCFAVPPTFWEKITICSLIHHDGAVFFDFHSFQKKNYFRKIL